MTIRRRSRQLLVVQPEALEHEPAVADAVADRLGDRLGLLVDLLEHEGLVAALLGALVVPVELERLVLDRLSVGANELDAVGRDRDDVAVVGEIHVARLAEEGGGVGGEEVLAVRRGRRRAGSGTGRRPAGSGGRGG